MQTSVHSVLPPESEFPVGRNITPGGWTFLLILASLIFSAGVCRGQTVMEAEEYRAKAALLYNLCKFISWPENGSTNNEPEFVISVLGNAPLLRALQAIDGKRIGGKPIKTIPISTVKDMRSCRVLCCSTEELKSLSRTQLKRLEDSHVLTVGETDGFVEAGGMVGVSVVEERLAFSINTRTARQAQIRMRAALLSLAEEIVEK